MHRDRLKAFVFAGLATFVANPALAVEVPKASATVMMDWVVLAFLAFFGSALTVFLVVVRRGYLSNLEEAKYYLLTVDEPDYYTPDWIREEEENALRQ